MKGISRRNFLKYAGLMGASSGALALAGCDEGGAGGGEGGRLWREHQDRRLTLR